MLSNEYFPLLHYLTPVGSGHYLLFIYLFIFIQVIKLMKIFHDMINFDIFFIDFERPKYHTNDNFFQGSNKSHPGTPSISSSLKPVPSPNLESVSAWRNYFIANEWQELMTKRKISIHLHISYVIGVLMVCEFSNGEFY